MTANAFVIRKAFLTVFCEVVRKRSLWDFCVAIVLEEVVDLADRWGSDAVDLQPNTVPRITVTCHMAIASAVIAELVLHRIIDPAIQGPRLACLLDKNWNRYLLTRLTHEDIECGKHLEEVGSLQGSHIAKAQTLMLIFPHLCVLVFNAPLLP